MVLQTSCGDVGTAERVGTLKDGRRLYSEEIRITCIKENEVGGTCTTLGDKQWGEDLSWVD